MVPGSGRHGRANQQQVLLAAVNHQDVGQGLFRLELQVGDGTAAGKFDKHEMAVRLHHADRFFSYHRDSCVHIELPRRPEVLLCPRIEQIEVRLGLAPLLIVAPRQQFPPEFGEPDIAKRQRILLAAQALSDRPIYGVRNRR